MRPFLRRLAAALLLATLGIASLPTAEACGPWPIEVLFWFPSSSGVSLEELVAGNLGILDRGQDRERLILAYRHLAGLGVPAADREAALAAFGPGEPEGSYVESWLAARGQVPGVSQIAWLEIDRDFERHPDGTLTYYDFTNCLGDAFSTAIATLAARVARFGAESREVREWLAGQDVVFARCREGSDPPAPLDASWDPLLRRDRDYQIAAALFYALRYDEAAAKFAAIARDAASPWSRFGTYLAGRSRLRAGDFDGAERAFRAVLASSELASLHASATGLLQLARLRRDPAAVRRELAARLTAPAPEAAAFGSAVFGDYVRLVRQLPAETLVADDDLAAWLQAMTTLDSREAVIARWRERQSLPWLVAALARTDGGEPEAGEILTAAAAAAVPQASPAFLTVAFHRARLLVAAQRHDEARAVLAALPGPAELSRASSNRLQWLRASLAANLDDYLRLALLPPVAVGYEDVAEATVWEEGFAEYENGATLLPDAAVMVLNRAVPDAELARLAGPASPLPEAWRRRVFHAAVTRAVIRDDVQLGRTLAPLAAELAPADGEPESDAASARGIAGELAAWLAAQDDEERRFTGALGLLHFPGLHPNLRLDVDDRAPLAEIDSLGGNWWCDGATEPHGTGDLLDEPAARFLSPAALARVREHPPLEGVPAGPVFLGEIVLAFARAHPDDARVPEALHLVVRATRYGCGHSYGDAEGQAALTANGRVSKSAFDLLHRRYPKSPWTAETPYWFQ
jgi:hypothetical protein